ncbi:MAG: ABC transporter permease [Candidatus Buchananbacteria bacterium]|jgi:ABC-type antimicrobial peptide transport system permease subunit
MRIADEIKLSFFVLRTNKVRSFLTGLGIIIGIAAVIIIMSAGAGAQSLIVNQLNSVGTNLIGILPGTMEEGGPPTAVLGIIVTTLKYEDAQAIADEVPNIVAVSSYNTGLATFSWQSNKVDVTYSGVMSSYPEVENTQVGEGRFFTNEEDRGSARVVVLGSQVAEDLFGNQSALGQKIKIGKEFFEVIGVMKPRGVSGFQNKDIIALIPSQTAQKIMLGVKYVNFIRAKINFPENIDRAQEDIKLLLRDRHNIRELKIDDFTVSNTKDAIKALTTVTDALKFFLAAIAGISLLVGGVGVMNIMLAAVNERVREIGLRKAVGAKREDILIQFLAESVTITLAGGIIGIIIGLIVSALIAVIARYLGYNWDLVVSPFSALLGFGVALAVGLIFGIYPANKAAKLNSIEALRYE